MYLVNKKDLKGLKESEVKARLDIVDYLTDWADEVFYEAKDKKSISLAGRYIRAKILNGGDTLAKLLDAVVLVDLSDFWKAVEGRKGKRDDVFLYGVFCILFSEVNKDMKGESKKLEGNIGYAPKLRFDISERRGSEVDESKEKKKGLFAKKDKTGKKDEQKSNGSTIYYLDEESLDEDDGDDLEDEIVEIDDKLVTPDNVHKLSIIAVGVICTLVIAISWMILI